MYAIVVPSLNVCGATSPPLHGGIKARRHERSGRRPVAPGVRSTRHRQESLALSRVCSNALADTGRAPFSQREPRTLGRPESPRGVVPHSIAERDPSHGSLESRRDRRSLRAAQHLCVPPAVGWSTQSHSLSPHARPRFAGRGSFATHRAIIPGLLRSLSLSGLLRLAETAA